MCETPTVTFRIVTTEEFAAARVVLETAGLPTADLSPERVTLVGAWEDARMVATIGLERADADGLLRSMAVVPDRRGRGLARALYERALVEAHRRGYAALYCLTGTADRFFRRLGFSEVARIDAPAAIQRTAQFSTLCSASTRLYTRALANTGLLFPADVLPLRSTSVGAAHFAVSLTATTLSYFELAPGARFERHAHAGEQITLVLEGTLHFAFDDRVVAVTTGTCVAVGAGIAHTVWAGDTPVKAVDAWSPPPLELRQDGQASSA